MNRVVNHYPVSQPLGTPSNVDAKPETGDGSRHAEPKKSDAHTSKG